MERRPHKVSGELELANALDGALEALARGVAPRRAAAGAPAHADELAPLLDLAAALRRVPRPEPRAAFRARVEARLRAARRPARPAADPRWWRRGLVAAALVALLGGLALNVAAQALPGEPLYGLKLGGEAVALALAGDELGRARVLVALSEEREREARRLAAGGPAELSVAADREHAAAVERAARALDCRSEAGPAGERQALCQRLLHQYGSLQLALTRAPPAARPALERALELLPPPGGRGQSLALVPPSAPALGVGAAAPGGSRASPAARAAGPTPAAVGPSVASAARGRPTLDPGQVPAAPPATAGLTVAALVEGSSRPSPAALTALRAQVAGTPSPTPLQGRWGSLAPLLREPPRTAIHRAAPPR